MTRGASTASLLAEFPGDDAQFHGMVAALIDSLVRGSEASAVHIVRIDNWFSRRWARFSGKVIGLAGTTDDDLRVPPFVPSRVVAEAHFTRRSDGEFVEDRPRVSLHRKQPSRDNLYRRLCLTALDTSFFWVSAESARSRRGSVLAYVRSSEGHVPLYTGLVADDEWRFVETIGTSVSALRQHVALSRAHAAEAAARKTPIPD